MNESILFLMRYFLYKERKIDNFKFDEQMKSVSNMGYDVWHLGVSKKEVFICHGGNQEKISKIYFYGIPIISKIFTYIAIYRSTTKLLNVKSDFKYSYIRSMFPTFSYINAIKSIKKHNIKTIMEIPTYPPNKESETDLRLARKPMYAFMKFFDKRVAKYVDLYALIGEKANNYLGRPAINVENGISLERLSLREPKLIDEEIHLIALAKVARWHGYDRLIEGMYNFYKNNRKIKVILHIVGPDGDNTIEYLAGLVEKYNLNNNILFEGPMYGEELSKLCNKCDIGVAALGLYHKGFYITSELKIREYMARGIPFIYAGTDYALDENNKYHIKISNNDSPVDIQKVVDFAFEMRKNYKIPYEMRYYATQNMTWNKQFEKVFNLLN